MKVFDIEEGTENSIEASPLEDVIPSAYKMSTSEGSKVGLEISTAYTEPITDLIILF